MAFSIFLLFRKNKRWIVDEFGLKFIVSCFLILFVQYTITNVFMLGSLKFVLTLAFIYYMVKEYRGQFIESLIQTIYRLVLITIPFYVVQILSVNLLKGILQPFNFSFDQQSLYGGVYVFLFNVNPASITRNSGFMWEPGAFGAVLIFLIIYEYIRNNKEVNKKIYFLSLYSLTTISTTTYLGLFLMAFLVLVNKNKRKPTLLAGSLLVLSILAVEIYQLPFIGEKFDFYFTSSLDYSTIDENINGGYTTGSSIGRFSGLLIELERLPKSPIVGNGWDNDFSDLGLSSEWSNPNGLASILGKFGLVGILFLGYGLYCLASYRKSFYRIENVVLLLILLMPIFSNPFEFNIIMWSLIMTGIYLRLQKRKRTQLSLTKYFSQTQPYSHQLSG